MIYVCPHCRQKKESEKLEEFCDNHNKIKVAMKTDRVFSIFVPFAEKTFKKIKLSEL